MLSLWDSVKVKSEVRRKAVIAYYNILVLIISTFMFLNLSYKHSEICFVMPLSS